MSKRSLAEAVLGFVDAKNAKAFADSLTENGAFVFGNAPPVIGRAAVAKTVSEVLSSFEAISHKIEDVWDEDNDVIMRLAVTYTRKDGKVLTLPCVNIWKLAAGDKIADYRIYMDINPVFA